MGQRANYILIENTKPVIYYSHWRANCITSDLYLGEKRFITFVKSCKVMDVLLDNVWIEGCVIINLDKKLLYFWSLEFGTTSATGFYLKELQGKWKNWSINLLYNEMYDVERILNIDYIVQQELLPLSIITKDEIINDEINEYCNSIIAVKTLTGIHITQLGDVSMAGILNYGENVIDVLSNKNEYQLPKEKEGNIFEAMIIDTVNKEILISTSEFGLWEQCANKWDGYSFKMGNFGYIEALKIANVNVDELIMGIENIKVAFYDLVKLQEDFSPVETAERLLQVDKDIKFHMNFFDDVEPKPTIIERIIKTINKLLSVVKL